MRNVGRPVSSRTAPKLTNRSHRRRRPRSLMPGICCEATIASSESSRWTTWPDARARNFGATAMSRAARRSSSANRASTTCYLAIATIPSFRHPRQPGGGRKPSRCPRSISRPGSTILPWPISVPSSSPSANPPGKRPRPWPTSQGCPHEEIGSFPWPCIGADVSAGLGSNQPDG